MTKNALLMNKSDNVVTVISLIIEQEEVIFESEGNLIHIKVKNTIPFGHKVAISDIKKGDTVIKYGTVIGEAKENIEAGDYVHTHNLVSLRAQSTHK
jgi:altronate dehydratase small subunit